MNEPKRRGRPPKPAGERTVRTTIALSRADLARLDAVPGKSRSDRIRWMLSHQLLGVGDECPDCGHVIDADGCECR